MSSIEELINIRKQKLDALKKAGKDPYPSVSSRKTLISKIKEEFSMMREMKAVLAGRIMSIRPHGKITFIDILDDSGQLQLFFSQSLDSYNDIKEFFDIGDFIEVSGEIFKTKAGEITLKASGFKMLAKSVRSIPSGFYRLKDEEEKLRHRYIDLIISPELKEVLSKRSLFINTIREFLINKEFIEVETPILELLTGGAFAAPFVTRSNKFDLDVYLRISPELHMKRLIVGGYERIFEIGKVFRNEGLSKYHLQEYTELEFYNAYTDIEQTMKFTEEMYTYIIGKVFGSLRINYKKHQLDFTPPWPRIDYISILKEKGIDLKKLDSDIKLREKALELGLPDDQKSNRGKLIAKIYKKVVSIELVQPCFLINQPIEISPLAKRKLGEPLIADRFQVVAMGVEIGNGYSELNDPIDQKDRLLYQQELRNKGDREAQMFDSDFIEALEYGMPPCVGFGMGIDRLFAILSNSKNIRDTVFFPILKGESHL